jgi:PAS domain S-box-containing protein
MQQDPPFVTSLAHASSDPFRLLVEGVKDYAIFMLDPGGTVSSWNPGAQNIKGYHADEILRRHHSCFYLAEDVAAGHPARDLKIALEQGRYEEEGQRQRKDGSTFWAIVTLTHLLDAAGQHVGFANVTRDITERRAAEDQLRASRERFRLLVEGVKDYAIFMLDPDGNVLTWNSGAEHITGYSAEETIGKNHAFYYPDEDVAAGKPQRELQHAALHGRLDDEGWRVRKGGVPFWSNGVLTALRDDAGNVRGFAKVTRDLSERRSLEAQLHQSQKMDAFGQLAGGIAHDFNNLLTVIGGYSELVLLDLGETDPLRPSLLEIQQAGARASSLTRRLLAFTRQQVMEPKVVDFNAVVTQTETMLRRLIGEDVHIVAALAPALAPVRVDPGQIEQVLVNLVLNARDAMPTGGTITIATQSAEREENADLPAGRYSVLSVTDTGSGMSPEVQARIFEPFFTTKEVGKGTGLGMAVVDGIMKQSKGRVEVRSRVGHGSTFTVFLPAVQEDVTPFQTGSSASPQHGTETILVVEDEDALREMTARALQRSGYTVLTASGGHEAMRVVAERPEGIDLLVTDVVMQGSSGLKVAEALRTRLPSLKVLYVSGYMDDAVLRHGVLQDEVAFLPKPFTVTSLTRKVRSVLDSSA